MARSVDTGRPHGFPEFERWQGDEDAWCLKGKSEES